MTDRARKGLLRAHVGTQFDKPMKALERDRAIRWRRSREPLRRTALEEELADVGLLTYCQTALKRFRRKKR